MCIYFVIFFNFNIFRIIYVKWVLVCYIEERVSFFIYGYYYNYLGVLYFRCVFCVFKVVIRLVYNLSKVVIIKM